MPEKQLSIESADPLLLFGFNDVYLRKIEDAFPDAHIAARGTEVHLEGEEATLHKVERVFDEMLTLLDRNDHLTEEDVDTILALFDSEDASAAPPTETGRRDAILTTPDGEVIKPRSQNQEHLVQAAAANDVVFAIGPAGTGKTYVAVAMAVAALNNHEVNRIVLSRPAVEAGEELGFLPGDFYEKVAPYLRPLYDALGEMMPRDELAESLEQDRVEVVPLAYMRGRTLKSSFVILDEAQNATTGQMKMFLTRLGPRSRAIVTGDITQTDLQDRSASGLIQVQHILEGIDGIEFIYLEREDVARHRLVQDIIAAYEEHDE
ncbi:MAG: phosphate starvation-inducible protein PhoH [Bacteroidetes bacterium SW_8_64_56]|nr:MAG: phosphate starvation-inducible protein PhoH [Bacteroidetes bacterium QH_1_64_81]PSQ73951.1 MAG: phosphate starvation-inducible protein PhoH [Bacteroidetes bacterium QH_6_64_77]PSQ74890.1 MAG: phosphate starvation-inducible protein PhoH [Bacteroidetes bacterium QH_7_64_110]PSQ97999.1 MAG: phosphate starvation-inducible protein PhoH [Bacteroidetes bacterium SW_7_64_58]PSR02631.1 MAG: phosphate starvation-inducible protein PhoH [Bacteroidetes bacterium SW_8_64_56]